jgi:hypothetical protein
VSRYHAVIGSIRAQLSAFNIPSRIIKRSASDRGFELRATLFDVASFAWRRLSDLWPLTPCRMRQPAVAAEPIMGRLKRKQIGCAGSPTR